MGTEGICDSAEGIYEDSYIIKDCYPRANLFFTDRRPNDKLLRGPTSAPAITLFRLCGGVAEGQETSVQVSHCEAPFLARDMIRAVRRTTKKRHTTKMRVTMRCCSISVIDNLPVYKIPFTAS